MEKRTLSQKVRVGSMEDKEAVKTQRWECAAGPGDSSLSGSEAQWEAGRISPILNPHTQLQDWAETRRGLPLRHKQLLSLPVHCEREHVLQPAEVFLLIVLGVDEGSVNGADHQLPTVHTLSSH